MEKSRQSIMMCDRIEDGHICVLVGRNGEHLSIPTEHLSITAHEKEFYFVEAGDDGSIVLSPAPREKEKQLERILALRQRLLGQK